MSIIINNRESVLASQNNFRVKILFTSKDFFFARINVETFVTSYAV